VQVVEMEKYPDHLEYSPAARFRIDMQQLGQLFQLRRKHIGKDNKCSPVKTPDDIVPAGAMPQSRQNPHHKQGYDRWGRIFLEL